MFALMVKTLIWDHHIPHKKTRVGFPDAAPDQLQASTGPGRQQG